MRDKNEVFFLSDPVFLEDWSILGMKDYDHGYLIRWYLILHTQCTCVWRDGYGLDESVENSHLWLNIDLFWEYFSHKRLWSWLLNKMFFYFTHTVHLCLKRWVWIGCQRRELPFKVKYWSFLGAFFEWKVMIMVT